jgi:membrane dipeptidase
MLIDSHLDLAFNALALGADLRLSLEDLRSSPYGQAASSRQHTPTVSLQALRAVDARIVFGTIFVQKPTPTFNLIGPGYTTVEEANVQGWAQLRYYNQLAAEGEITLVVDQQSLGQSLAGTCALPGLVPLMEGADPITDPSELEVWIEAGLRIVGLAWSATRYSGGTGAPGPLTPAGRVLLQEMGRSGLALDMSHLSDASFWEALTCFDGPLIASHANCRAFVPTDRQLTDDMIKAIVERDGVIGVVPYNKFLVPDWLPGDAKASVSIDAVVRQIEHICQLAGDTHHVGIGSDFDGGFGVESLPAEIDSILDLPRIGDALRVAGWKDEDVSAVMGGNWARWLRRALP